jgi:REP element-mobilizing transposase RayT
LLLPDVVHRFKSFTTARYRHGVKNHGWTPFPGRLWQRNDYEHIVRNDDQVRRIRQYIADNPAKWALDPENPARG